MSEIIRSPRVCRGLHWPSEDVRRCHWPRRSPVPAGFVPQDFGQEEGCQQPRAGCGSPGGSSHSLCPTCTVTLGLNKIILKSQMDSVIEASYVKANLAAGKSKPFPEGDFVKHSMANTTGIMCPDLKTQSAEMLLWTRSHAAAHGIFVNP